MKAIGIIPVLGYLVTTTPCLGIHFRAEVVKNDINGSKRVKTDIAPKGTSFPIESKVFQCGSAELEGNSVTVTCRKTADRSTGSSGTFHCPIGSKDRGLGLLATFSDNEFIKVAIHCDSE